MKNHEINSPWFVVEPEDEAPPLCTDVFCGKIAWIYLYAINRPGEYFYFQVIVRKFDDRMVTANITLKEDGNGEIGNMTSAELLEFKLFSWLHGRDLCFPRDFLFEYSDDW